MIQVLIPNRKHDRYVGEAEKALRNQTYDDFWIQVVPDYPKIGKGFRLNEVVPGVFEEWMTVHDADDLSMPRRFETCAKYFDFYDVIYHDFFVDGKVVVSGEWDREKLKKNSYVAASTVFVRTEIARKVGWETNGYGQDWIWLNLIAEHTDKIKYVPEPLLIYRNLGFTRKLRFKSVRRYFIRKKIRELCG